MSLNKRINAADARIYSEPCHKLCHDYFCVDELAWYINRLKVNTFMIFLTNSLKTNPVESSVIGDKS